MVRPATEEAFRQLAGPYLGLAVATRMLHLKRPAMYPIVIALVMDLVGGRGSTGTEAIDHLRRVGQASREALSSVAEQVARPDARCTEVRLLDAILWCIHPASSFAQHLRGRVNVDWTG